MFLKQPAETHQAALSRGALIPPHELFSHDRRRVEELCRERTDPVYVGNGHVLSRVLARYKMVTDTADHDFAPHIIMDGYWEIWLTEYMVRTIQQGWTVLDVGANYGYYSVLMADLVGDTGQMIAVEPNPAAAQAVEFTTSVNGFADRSTIIRKALSDKTGTARLSIPTNHASGAAISADGEGIEVETISIDELTAGLPRVDFIKIDAEGAEPAIFAGMTETLARHKPVVVMEFDRDRDGARELAEAIVTASRRLQFLGHDGQPSPSSPDALMETPGVNLLVFNG